MMTPDRARTRDAVANQRHLVAGVTSERRRSVTTEAQKLIDLEGAVDRVVRLLRDGQPKHTEGASWVPSIAGR
jgi:hypothetical protein